jgi:two-component system, NarL family, invasion response regulator UvrY
MTNKKIPVALVDDHILLRNGLANLINSFEEYQVIFEANNGIDFLEKIKINPQTAIVLMDINMPEMDGYDTTLWLKRNVPEVKVLALSMYDSENSIIRMLKSGARGYVLKDIEPGEFKTALNALVVKGFYYSEMVSGKLMHAVNSMGETENNIKTLDILTAREIDFLKLACSELTYKEIADKMYLSARTIDGYRDDLFEKLHLKTRVGLVLFAIKNGIVNLNTQN